MFYHPGLLGKTGPLGTVWIAGHSSKKISKKKIMSTKILVICADLETHIGKFALPVRASLLLGATVIFNRQTTYLLQDAKDLRKRIIFSRSTKIVINMKEKPKDKMKKALKLPTDMISLAPAWDFEVLMQDELEEIEDDELLQAFQNNMARPEDITLPEANYVVDERMQKFLEDQQRGPAIDEFGGAFVDPFADIDVEHFRNTGQIREPVPIAADGASQTRSELGVTAASVTNVDLPSVEEPEIAQAAESKAAPLSQALQETEGPAQVRPRAVRRRGGRVGPIIDSITLISKDKIKEQLADPLFASKPRESPSRTITAAQAVFKNRLIWSSDSSFGKVLQDNCKSVYGESTRSLREKHRGSIQEQDPFSWCVGETPPVVNIQREAQDNLVPAVDMNLAFEDHILPEAANVSSVARRDTTSQLQLDAISIVPLVLDASEDPLFPHANITIESSEPAAVAGRVNEEDNFELPAAKRRRRDLRPDEKVEKLLEAADYMELRYEKFKQGGVEEVSFEKIMDGNSRKKIARCFAFMLRLVQDGRIRVRQEKPYDPIMIQKVDPFLTLTDPAILSRPGYQ